MIEILPNKYLTKKVDIQTKFPRRRKKKWMVTKKFKKLYSKKKDVPSDEIYIITINGRNIAFAHPNLYTKLVASFTRFLPEERMNEITRFL